MIDTLRRAAHDPAIRRFVIFLAVGGLNTVFGYAVFAAFSLMGAGHFAAVTGATALGILFNFQSIGRIVFHDARGRLFPRFLAIYALQFCGNLALLAGLSRAGVAALIAEALILPVLAMASFVLMRRFVFDRSPVSRSTP